jgi:hypothetical protein
VQLVSAPPSHGRAGLSNVLPPLGDALIAAVFVAATVAESVSARPPDRR